MKTNHKHTYKAVFALLSSLLATSSAMAALSLPGVSACSVQPYSNFTVMCMKYGPYETYVASQHDDFISYSINALATIQKVAESVLPIATYGDWGKMSSGSGQVDIGIYIKAAGGGVADNPDPFPNALNSQANQSTYTGVWGNDVAQVDPLTVEEVYDWLQAPPAAQYPYFYLDLSEPQNESGGLLLFTGHVYITEADGTTKVNGADWSYDNNAQAGVGDYDPGDLNDSNDPDWVVAPATITTLINGIPYEINNNRGSGSPDFIAYSPTMDLQNYFTDGDGRKFWAEFNIAGMAAAGEEIYLTKLTNTTQVPEPNILALLGLGLVGLGLVHMRKGRLAA